MSDEPERKNLPALTSGGVVRAIVPQTFDEAWRIANAVCVAGMAPWGLNTPEKATVAILHGMEIGLPPMIALQSIAIINGRPSLYGDTVLGLIQSSGKLETMKEWMEGAADQRVAICRVVRRGDPEPKIGRFSVNDAKIAKLWGKLSPKGEPTPWVTYPERMLKMRARTLALRDGFADVLRGIAFAEEMRDVVEHDPAEARPTPPPPPTPPTPPKPSLSQPIQPPKGTPVPPQPPKPPKPQQPPVRASKPDLEISTDDFLEVSENESALLPDNPSELLTGLDNDMAAAATAEAIEDVWDQHDLLAILEQMPNGEDWQTTAMGILKRHLARVAGNG